MMLTKAQQEIAAKQLCAMRGIDPNELVAHSAEPDHRGYAAAILQYSPAWRLALKEVESLGEIIDAMEFASGFKP